MASTNGERSMRPRGREVEKRVGSALSVTPKNGKFYRKSGLDRNLEKERSSKQHPPVILLHNLKFTLVSCVQFPSTLISPVWNRIDKQAGQGVSKRGSTKGVRKFPGNFCKFCEPLERVRARFSYSTRNFFQKSALVRKKQKNIRRTTYRRCLLILFCRIGCIHCTLKSSQR